MVPVAVLVAAGAGWFIWQDQKSLPPPPLPADAVSPPGTELGDGFKVPEGAVLLGPVLRQGYGGGDRVDAWLAVLAVTDRPIDSWKRYLHQIAGVVPDESWDPEEAPGCRTDPAEGFKCDITFEAPDPSSSGALIGGAQMVNPPDDVTGRYLMVVNVYRSADPGAAGAGPQPRRWQGGSAPGPGSARKPPRQGEPLAPSSTVYRGADRRYVLLEGSEMLAQWGTGSLTGGFDVLLKVTPGARVRTVAEAYARQGAQFEGETEIFPYESAGTTYVRYLPPGGAGGYQAVVYAVDQPGDRDYVFYSLTND